MQKHEKGMVDEQVETVSEFIDSIRFWGYSHRIVQCTENKGVVYC